MSQTPDLQFDIRINAEGSVFLYFPLMTVSDIHYGTKHSHAKKTAHMFQNTESANLFLIGDVIDGEAMMKKKFWKFPEWHRQGIGHICRKADEGTDVTYILGNHDVALRGDKTTMYNGVEHPHRDRRNKSIFGIKFADVVYHPIGSGLTGRFEHGDRHDGAEGKYSELGTFALDVLANIDGIVRYLPGCDGFSLASFAKKAVKGIIDKYLGTRARISRSIDQDSGADAVFYGHSHMPGINRTSDGKLVVNDGSCTEDVICAVIDRNGTPALIEWHKDSILVRQEKRKPRRYMFSQLGISDMTEQPPTVAPRYLEKADRLIRLAYRVWPPKRRRQFRKAMEFDRVGEEMLEGHSTAYIPLPKRQRLKSEISRPVLEAA